MTESECPEIDVFYDYLEQKLSKENTRTFEHHISDCEMCSDALDGFGNLSREKTKEAVFEINTKISSSESSSKKYIWLAVASIFITFGLGFMLFQNLAQKEKLSYQYEKMQSVAKSVVTESAPLQDNIETEEDFFEEVIAKKEVVEQKIQQKKKLAIEGIQKVAEKEIPLEKEILEEVVLEAEESMKDFSKAESMVESNDFLSSDDESNGVFEVASAPKPTSKPTKTITTSKPEMLAYTESLMNTSNKEIAFSDKKVVKIKKTDRSFSYPTRESENDVDSFETGVALYNQFEYKKALKHFQQNRLANESVSIYIVLTHIMMSENKTAFLEIEGIIQNKKHPKYYDALWLKVYLLKAENQNFEKELNVLKKDKSPYLEKANQMK